MKAVMNPRTPKSAKLEPRCGRPDALQTDRNQQQRRESWLIAVFRLKPFEEAECDEQHVDALLGQGRPVAPRQEARSTGDINLSSHLE